MPQKVNATGGNLAFVGHRSRAPLNAEAEHLAYTMHIKGHAQPNLGSAAMLRAQAHHQRRRRDHSSPTHLTTSPSE